MFMKGRTDYYTVFISLTEDICETRTGCDLIRER
jgi:hypothetical protein